MTVRFLVICSLLVLAVILPVRADNGWSTVAYPLAGPSQVIGSHAAGCIAGAMALPLAGNGYQVMRPSRNRYYGHPMLVRFVERLGQQAAARGARLLIGDLAQPRGGPMPNGHRSHQSGLDVDVWFLQQPRDRLLSRADTERIEMPTMVRAAEGTLNPSRWSPRYRDMLKMAAQSPEVDRIFVNAIIKQALCYSEANASHRSRFRPAMAAMPTWPTGSGISCKRRCRPSPTGNPNRPRRTGCRSPATRCSTVRWREGGNSPLRLIQLQRRGVDAIT